MAYTVTSSGRRVVMAALLALAVAGGVIRYFAPNPSTLHDVGTLLLVLWLPAVGNLIAWLVGKVPRKPPPRTDFEAGAAFAPQVQAHVEAAAMPAEVMDSLDPDERKCTILVGRQGFTARLAEPLKQTFAKAGEQTVGVELLNPDMALSRLREGTDFHLLAGAMGIARGRVVRSA
jgi:hypothetical protein